MADTGRVKIPTQERDKGGATRRELTAEDIGLRLRDYDK
jgi:hypothetical protein